MSSPSVAPVQPPSTDGDDAPSMSNEQRREGQGYVLSAWARGPDTINFALWGPVVLLLAASDATCYINPETGWSSGADGQSCTVETDWNQTLWSSISTHSACDESITVAGIDPLVRTVHRDSADCKDAFAQYRNHTSFTCNCTGDQSFLGGEGGLRPANVLAISYIIDTALVALFIPVIGSMIDFTPHRKRIWTIFAICLAVSSALMAVIGSGYVWVVGLAVSTVAAVTYEWMWVPIAAYLPEISDIESERSRYAGMGSAASYSSQIVFGIILIALAFTVPDAALGASIGCVLCGVWIGVFMWRALRRMRPRPASQKLLEKQSLVKQSWFTLVETFRTMWRENPQALKYLLSNALSSCGATATIGMLTTYCVTQLQLSSTQFLIAYIDVLFFGVPACAVYIRISKYVSAKWSLLFVVVLLFLLTLILPLWINQPGMLVEMYCVAGLYGVGFGTFYAVNVVAICDLIPKDREAQYMGLMAFAAKAIGWVPPLIYAAIVQSLNDHRLAMAHCSLYFLLGAIILVFVDYSKSPRKAGAGAAQQDLAGPDKEGGAVELGAAEVVSM